MTGVEDRVEIGLLMHGLVFISFRRQHYGWNVNCISKCQKLDRNLRLALEPSLSWVGQFLSEFLWLTLESSDSEKNV